MVLFNECGCLIQNFIFLIRGPFQQLSLVICNFVGTSSFHNKKENNHPPWVFHMPHHSMHSVTGCQLMVSGSKMKTWKTIKRECKQNWGPQSETNGLSFSPVHRIGATNGRGGARCSGQISPCPRSSMWTCECVKSSTLGALWLA